MFPKTVIVTGAFFLDDSAIPWSFLADIFCCYQVIANKVSSAGRITASQCLGGAFRRTTAVSIPTPSRPQAIPPTFQLTSQHTLVLARETVCEMTLHVINRQPPDVI